MPDRGLGPEGDDHVAKAHEGRAGDAELDDLLVGEKLSQLGVVLIKPTVITDDFAGVAKRGDLLGWQLGGTN